ncbi:phosphoadenosine phosphosulfate reductase domain-containing protein [Thermodesulfatator autotrophicus]|uniref:4Fe-4S ferredoxin-type domain-containing protein n=1 Tax=Thermodesulfatator autotrophicus TaxID=1795632 RepID=A0A177E6T5_9BACT|nr:phosphoadenosine phosphosulfate reductase family protein [Thermodesulfatator autotrophicus]OAG27657.1 hypothetical protein TH606_05970 [Thermodesulfatator autotrophicus]
MYNLIWDEETGGILLTEKEGEGPSPEIRPVFREELELLGLNKVWTIPETEAPLLWASPGKAYFYRGRKVAEVRGGGFYQKPQVTVFEEGLALYPVDVAKMLRRNRDFLLDLTHKTLDFIAETYRNFRPRVHITCVSFSGGKDSWVLLDLVQRVLTPKDYVVVFNDTDMELSATYESVKMAQKYYEHLNFFTARSSLKARDSWKIFGPPSRIQRWCCAVHKSVPTLILLRELCGQPDFKVLLFEGVRALESERRANYPQVSPGAKHERQINARPVIAWSAVEVFLYLFWRKLPLHKGYRFGLSRVGCVVCPLASTWSTFVQGQAFLKDCKPFLDILKDYALACGKKAEKEIKEFINSQAWGARAGGWYLKQAHLINIKNTAGLEILFPEKAYGRLKRWLKIAGHFEELGHDRFSLKTKKGEVYGTLKKKGQDFSLKIEEDKNLAGLKGLLKAAVQKAVFCTGCQACEVECPFGALFFDNGQLFWNKDSCRHCLKCFSFAEGGCFVAKSLNTALEKPKRTHGLDKYWTFGFRKEWLKEYQEKREKFWDNHSLGPRQIKAFRAWLRDAGLIERRALKLTPLGERLIALGADEPLTWEVIWVKLSYGSPLIRWFLEKVSWGETISKKELEERLGEDIAKRTRENAISALLGLFENTPLTKISQVEKIKRKRILYKQGLKELTLPGLLFALFSLAEFRGRYEFSFSELMAFSPETPYGLFGLSREKLSALLRAAATNFPDWLKVDLVYDLEAIYLAEEKSAEAVLDDLAGIL